MKTECRRSLREFVPIDCSDLALACLPLDLLASLYLQCLLMTVQQPTITLSASACTNDDICLCSEHCSCECKH